LKVYIRQLDVNECYLRVNVWRRERF